LNIEPYLSKKKFNKIKTKEIREIGKPTLLDEWDFLEVISAP
jgi:hypothetical protein